MKQQYFPHDCNARNDQKLQKLLMQQGMEGVGIYWCLVELMYENNGKLDLQELETYAFALRTDIERIRSVIRGFGLFKTNTRHVWSESVNRRLDEINERSEKARNSANHRWHKPTENGVHKKSLNAKDL